MQTVKLTIEYDGTDFSGWQIQPHHRTVQGELEQALHTLLSVPVRITGAGRTDAGVHALGQTAHFQTQKEYEPGVYVRALNTLLPKDIRITAAEHRADGFHARYDAVKRKYRYVISKKQRAVGRMYAWFPPWTSRFSFSEMRRAAEYIKGEQDFTSFAKSCAADGTCRSVVYSVSLEETQGYITFEIEAVRYFHNMIRILVGTLFEVGCGRLTAQDFSRILTQKDRTAAGVTAPPHGLFLVCVDYREEQ